MRLKKTLKVGINYIQYGKMPLNSSFVILDSYTENKHCFAYLYF